MDPKQVAQARTKRLAAEASKPRFTSGDKFSNSIRVTEKEKREAV